MKNRIEIFRDEKIAYIRNIGPYGDNNIKKMEELKTWAKKNNLMDNASILYGIAHDNPEITEPKNCRYDVCIGIKDKQSVSEIDVANISGGRYFVFELEHTAEAMQKAWRIIFAEIQRFGYQFDNKRVIVERYKMNMIKEHKCEICVPIV